MLARPSVKTTAPARNYITALNKASISSLPVCATTRDTSSPLLNMTSVERRAILSSSVIGASLNSSQSTVIMVTAEYWGLLSSSALTVRFWLRQVPHQGAKKSSIKGLPLLSASSKTSRVYVTAPSAADTVFRFAKTSIPQPLLSSCLRFIQIGLLI